MDAITGEPRPPRPLWPTGLTALRALVVARWLCWAWLVGVVVFAQGQRHTAVAWACVVVTGAFAVLATGIVSSRPERAVSWPFVVAEVGIAVALSVLDGLVFDAGHAWGNSQSLATQWPLLAAATAGVAAGPVVAALCGALIGPAEWVAAELNGVDRYGAAEIVSLVGTSLLFAAIGAVIGWWAVLLRRAEDEISDHRARDEVARVMHDTVLQTLALVERRAVGTDPELASAVRDADRDLRAYLFGAQERGRSTFGGRIRRETARVQRGADIPVVVNVLDDGLRLDPRTQDLLARAVGEAVANALEHAGPSQVVVFAESTDDGGAFASVRDDGGGFDPTASGAGHGLAESIIARVESVGGRVEVRSSPGSGTEVAMWCPPPARGSRP